MLRISLLAGLLCCIVSSVFAQKNPSFSCFSDELLQKHMQQDPAARAFHEALEQQCYQQIAAAAQKGAQAAYTIPVVVHIIHQNGPENISDLQVEQGIQHLNAAFANAGYYDNGDGVTTPFQFCLARRKPDGSPTNGIVRVQSVLTTLDPGTQDLDMKNLSRWDPTRYVNIWLVSYIGGSLAGYAYFPSAHGLDMDGIVMEAQYFGSTPAQSTVLTHEMGHYLGLYHTFQDGCTNNDCLSDGDRVCDTPPDQSTTWTPCGTIQNSCGTDTDSGFAVDQNDMTINYMDYATWDCYNAFTQGQSARMEFFLLNVRQSLLQSDGCKDPCLLPVTAAFNASAGGTLPAGTNVQFTNTSVNGATYEWSVNGTPLGSSTDLNYTLANEGIYVFLLKATGIDPNCTDLEADTIRVICPLQTSFLIDKPAPLPGETLNCTATGSGATLFEWTINGVPFGNTPIATVTMPGPGAFTICLNESNAYCTRSYCRTVVVDDTSDCGDDNLFRLIFTPSFIGDMVKLPNGSYLTCGSYWADSLYMLHLTPEGAASNAYAFNIFPGENEYLMDIEAVGGDYVVGAGISSHLAPASVWKSFVFKYDVVNQTFVWVKVFKQANFQFEFLATDIKELPNSGNYFIGSQNRSQYARSFHLVLDKTTGDVVSSEGFWEPGMTDALRKTRRAGQQLYSSGYRISAAPYAAALLSARDDAGQMLWSKEYHTTNAHLYSFSMATVNNALYLLADGVDTNRYFVVIKTDMFGQPLWARRVDAGVQTLITNGKTIIPTSDGVIVHLNGETVEQSLLYKFDENGELKWHRVLELPTAFRMNDLIEDNSAIWLLGAQAIANGRSFMVRIDPEKMFGGLCKLYTVASARAYDVPVTVADVVLLEENLSYTIQQPAVPLRPASFIIQDWCPAVTCPEICDNGLDDDADGYVDCFDTGDCTCDDLPECIKIDALPPAEINIEGKLAWSSPDGMGYIGWTPVVGNLNPKQDDMPEIVVGRFINALSTDELLIFRGDGSDATAPRKLIVPARMSIFHPTTPAIGDLDGDGTPELVLLCNDHRIRVYTNYQPGASPVMTLMAVSVDTTILHTPSKPLLADFNGDGLSEIYVGNEVFRFDFSTPGNPVLRRTAPATTVPNGRETHDNVSSCSIAADLLTPVDCAGDPDCNGLEIAAGYAIYSVDLDPFDGDPVEIKKQRDLSLMPPATNFSDGHTTVGDVNLDGTLDVIVTGRRAGTFGVYIWNKNGLIRFFPLQTFGSSQAGLAAVGNVFDDTGNGAAQDFPEIVVYARERVVALNLNAATQTPTTPWWWSQPITDASGFSSPALFDFNRDGLMEPVVRDLDSLFVMYGGKAPFPPGVSASRRWFSYKAPARFLDPYPVVADVDNDGEAEIVVIAEKTVSPIYNYLNEYLTVLESDVTKGVPWAPARPFWNQFNYFPVSVNDDLSIPKKQQAGQLELPGPGSGKRPFNIFLGQPGQYDSNFNTYVALPDATVSVDSVLCLGDSLALTIRICNGGSGILPESTPIRFYKGNPAQVGAVLLPLTSALPRDVAPDSCMVLNIKVPAPPGGPDVFVVVNDDGSKAPPLDWVSDFPTGYIDECDFGNNAVSVSRPLPPPPFDLGPDVEVCQNGVWTFEAGAGYVSYKWSNLSTEKSITVYEPGLYLVEAQDVCGNVFSDSVRVTVNPATLIDLGSDTLLCGGAPIAFSLSGFAEYTWLPANVFSCTTCSDPVAQPTENVTLTVVARTALGCYSADSLRVTIAPELQWQLDTAVCAGQTITLFGTVLSAGAAEVFLLPSATGCDTIVTVIVGETPIVQTAENQAICAGDSSLIFGQWQQTAGIYSQTFTAAGGCDSVHTVTLEVLPALAGAETRNICTGDSSLIFGQWQQTAGIYTQTFTAAGGCDSVHTVTLAVLPALAGAETRSICTGDSSLIFGQWQQAAGIYSQTFTAAGGCDSIHTVTLAVLPALAGTEIRSICTGDSSLIFGQWQQTAGIYSQTFTAAGGCDSVHTVTLEVLPALAGTETRSICTGDSSLIFGQWQQTAGIYSQTFTAAGGCDSVHTVTLAVLPALAGTETRSICTGDSSLIFGQWQQTAGIYSQTFTAAGGCDSVHTVTLDVLPALAGAETRSICTGDSSLIFGQWQQTAGIYSQTFTAAGGCDSVHTVTLAVLPALAGAETRSICTGDSSLIFGQWQQAAGVYSQTFTAAGGCDSIHTVTLETLPLPSASPDVLAPLCQGDSSGRIEIIGAAGLEYSLNGGPFLPAGLFDQLPAGVYHIRIRDAAGCIAGQSLGLPDPPALSLDMPGDTLIDPGAPVTLQPLVGADMVLYSWLPPLYLDCSDCPAPVSTPSQSVTYVLTIQNADGCAVSDSVRVAVRAQEESGIYVPNTIRQGSNSNGLFAVFAPTDVLEVKRMEIFDRWGNLLFSLEHAAPDGTQGWDGTARGQVVMPGVYVYVLELELADGTRMVKRGDVTVLR
jgi:hypothetical protein